MELPIDSTTVFYDGTRKFHSGTPPYFLIIKELSNAIQGEIVYRTGDNQKANPVMVRESEIGPFPNELEKEKNPSVPST